MNVFKTKRIVLIVGLIFFLALAGTVSAGGWASVVLDELPYNVQVNETVELGFMVRQHGVTPINTAWEEKPLEPHLYATHTQSGQTIRAEASQEGRVGHFALEVSFPRAGQWQWGINIEPFPAVEFEALTVVANSAERDTADYGRALFRAKGCTDCHMYRGISSSAFGPITGPNLTDYEAESAFLRAWLQNPKKVRPGTKMPNLNLNDDEISALIDFLNQSPGNSTAKASTQANYLFSRPHGAKGILTAYTVPRLKAQFSLPPGIATPTTNKYISVKAGMVQSKVKIFDLRSGQMLKEWSVPGSWVLGGISPNGEWMALSQLPNAAQYKQRLSGDNWQTNIQVLNTISGQVAHTMSLEGNFEVEAISDNGESLFLIEHLPALKAERYRVRLYDLSEAELDPNPLRDKTVQDELMTGLAWGSITSPDGEWLLTLYLNTKRDSAFIHALNLNSQLTLCLNLPSAGGDIAALQHYALALSENGKTVYAANSALGIVTEISLTSFQTQRDVAFKVPAVIKSKDTDISYAVTPPMANAILSNDGKTLYFSSGHDLWAYDTETKSVRGPFLSDAEITGLHLSADDEQVYVALKNQRPLVLEMSEKLTRK